jgi:hypothetical protein
LACHVRKQGDDAPHICNICLSQMHATTEHAPNWTRATCCGEVWHECCIHRYAREAESTTNTFKCPQCKQEHHVDDLNDWDASVVIERVFPDDAYSPGEDSSSEASSSEEDCDDEDSSNDDRPNPKREGRGNPNNCEYRRRVTRSNTTSL